MKNKTLEKCKKWLDDYIGLESELTDTSWNVDDTKILIYRAGKDKPILLKLIIADYGDGWELCAVEHKFKLEEVSKKMRNE